VLDTLGEEEAGTIDPSINADEVLRSLNARAGVARALSDDLVIMDPQRQLCFGAAAFGALMLAVGAMFLVSTVAATVIWLDRRRSGSIKFTDA